ncbi:hypothetical protein P3S68_015705 [Capsicum galapagoense]
MIKILYMKLIEIARKSFVGLDGLFQIYQMPVNGKVWLLQNFLQNILRRPLRRYACHLLLHYKLRLKSITQFEYF